MFVDMQTAKHTLYSCTIAICLSVREYDGRDYYIDPDITLKEAAFKGFLLPELINYEGRGIELFEYIEHCILYILEKQCYPTHCGSSAETIRNAKQTTDKEARKDFTRLYNELPRGNEIIVMTTIMRRLALCVVNQGIYDNRQVFRKINEDLVAEYDGCNNYSSDMRELISLLSYLNSYVKSRVLVEGKGEY